MSGKKKASDKSMMMDPEDMMDGGADEATEQPGGWKDKLIRVLTEAMHDRLVFGTKKYKSAIKDAADEPDDAPADGFKKLSKK